MLKSQLAFVFPGQGSQSLGMLSMEYERYDVVRATFSEASDTLGYDAWAICQDNPDDKLNQTEYTQPLLLVASVAMWRAWQHETGVTPGVMAGHSLGEYSALVCAQALGFTDAVTLVARRGQLMQSAVGKDEGAMAAIIGLDDAVVNELCETHAQGECVSCANYNSPGQVVIAGVTAAVERVVAAAKPAGAKMAKMLEVSVPSHCRLMQPAAQEFEEALNQVNLKLPQIPVYHNVDATVKTDINEIRLALGQQMFQSVLWVDSVNAMRKQGCQHFVECGPGKVLTGIIKRIDKTVQLTALSATEDYSQVFETA